MSFLNEATYNVKKGSAPPNPDTLEDDDVVNIEEKSPKNLGYGKDPKTGKFKSMSSNDAIKHFLAQVKQGVEDEGDEWPTLKEDLADKAAKFIRKSGGAEYKTDFSDFAKEIKNKVIVNRAKAALKKTPPSSDPNNPNPPRKFTVGLLKNEYTVDDGGTIKDSKGNKPAN